MLTAFVVGQLFQLLFVSVSNSIYVSNPVIWCAWAGFITALLVGTTMFITVLVTGGTGEHIDDGQRESDRATPFVPKDEKKAKPLFVWNRPPLDTDPEDIDEIDENERKEG